MKLSNLRDTNKQLIANVWPGGYPVMYLDKQGSILCPECARAADADRAENPDLAPVDGDVYWEGPAMACDECGAEIESAYGDPESDDDDDAE